MSQSEATEINARSFCHLQQRQKHYDDVKIMLLLTFLFFMLLLSVSAGDIWLWPTDWFSDDGLLFVWQLRSPRVLAVVGVGAALAVSGAAMQALFNNSLADPGLLGVSSGAGVAMVLAMFAGSNAMHLGLVSGACILGAMVITLLLLLFSIRGRINNSRLLLFGMALGIACSAFMTWAFYFSNNMDLRKLVFWMMGGFGGIDWNETWLVLALFPVIFWLVQQGETLNLLSINELTAKQLGVEVKNWRCILVLCIGWLVGVSVAIAGMIGFIGFVVPHLLRLWGLTDHKRLMPGCVLAGAGVLLASDTIARVALCATEIPVGVVTATLGAPIFIWMLLYCQNGTVK